MINSPYYVIVHHSTTADNVILSSFDAIKRYHMSYAVNGVIVNKEQFKFRFHNKKPEDYFKKPWSDIGYHFIMEKINNQVDVREGRDILTSGAHTYQRMPDRNGKMLTINNQSIAYCVVGNYDKDILPEDYLDRLIEEIKLVIISFNIPVNNVIGHREVPGVTKSCPGNNVDMNLIRNMLSK